MLKDAIKRYKNHTVEAAEVIEELIGLARDIMSSAKVNGYSTVKVESVYITFTHIMSSHCIIFNFRTLFEYSYIP